MGLYDRDYYKQQTKKQNNAADTSKINVDLAAPDSNLAAFIKQTYQLFAASLLVASAGAYIGYQSPVVMQYYWLFVILEFALIFGISFARGNNTLGLFMLTAFAFVSGLTISTILTYYIGVGAGGIVAQALMLTMVAFLTLSVFAINTEKDFISYGRGMFWTLIVIVVASLINAFVFHNPIAQVAISGVSAILFSMYIIYDTQNIIKGRYLSPIDGALSLYIDFINLFVSLVQILGFFSDRD